MAPKTQVGGTHLSFWSEYGRRRCFEPPRWSLGCPQIVHDVSQTVARRKPGGRQTVVSLPPDGRRTVPALCELPLGYYWAAMGRPFVSARGSPKGVPWQSLGSLMASPWQPYGSPMAAMWQPRGSPMPATWQSHGGHMATPWRPHGSHVAAPMQPHGSPMAAPWQPGTGRKRWETIENDRKRQRTTDRER